MLERIFRSNAEVQILKVVLFEDGFHLRRIAKEADVSPYEAKRELDNMVSLGILKKEKEGNMVFFYKNNACPFLIDLRNIYSKTEGFFFELKKTIEKINGIEYAFVFGSFAKGNFGPKSDIDLMIIGNANEMEISREIFKLQKKTMREINFIIWNKNDLKNKIEKKSNFLYNISNNKKWIVGDEHEFVSIIKRAYN